MTEELTSEQEDLVLSREGFDIKFNKVAKEVRTR